MAMYSKFRTLEQTNAPAVERSYTTQRGYFTIDEVISSIVDFERFACVYRPGTTSFAINSLRTTRFCDKFFEGLELNEDGESYSILWR